MSLHSTCSNTVSSCDFQAIDSIHQVGVYCLALVPANTLPKTPLGGIHLSETKQLFLEGSLHPCNVLMCPHTCVTNLPKPRQKQPGMPRGWEGSCGVSGGPLQPMVGVSRPLGLVNGGDSQPSSPPGHNLEEWACSPPAVFSAGGWLSAGLCWAADPLRAGQGCRTAGVKRVPVSCASFVGHQTSICCDLGDAQNF